MHKINMNKQDKLIAIRPEVFDFALAMEIILRDNDYKGGWKEITRLELTKRMLEELAEYLNLLPLSDRSNLFNSFLSEIHFYSADKSTKKEKKKEIIDFANFSMMLYHDINNSKER